MLPSRSSSSSSDAAARVHVAGQAQERGPQHARHFTHAGPAQKQQPQQQQQQVVSVADDQQQQQQAFPVIRSLSGQPLLEPLQDSSGSQQQQGQEQQQPLTAPPPPAPQHSWRGDDGGISLPRPPAPPPRGLQGDSQCTEYWMPPHSVSAPNKQDTTADAAAAAAAAATAAAEPAAAAVALFEPAGSTAAARRRLAQLAPKYCGKLGTYVPNYYSNTDGSMFGISISPNADGSVIAVGSPLNGAEATEAGGASVLTSWSDKTCEYAVVPVWQPDGCYKYFGAQVRGAHKHLSRPSALMTL